MTFWRSGKSITDDFVKRIHLRIGCHAATRLSHIDDSDDFFFRWRHDVSKRDEILATVPNSDVRSIFLSCNASEEVLMIPKLSFVLMSSYHSPPSKRRENLPLSDGDIRPWPNSYVKTSRMTNSKTWLQIFWRRSFRQTEFSSCMNSEVKLTFYFSQKHKKTNFSQSTRAIDVVTLVELKT